MKIPFKFNFNPKGVTRPDPATVYLATKLAYNPSKEHLINSLILNLEDRQSEVKQIAKMALKLLAQVKYLEKKYLSNYLIWLRHKEK